MVESHQPNVAIVDYGMGNLFSIKNACESVGLRAVITSSGKDIMAADAIILPGVGAFGDAMDMLRQLDLIPILQKEATYKPFIGICLGMQLMMEDSYEFGHHKGLGIIRGSVTRFENLSDEAGMRLKVPHIGWNRIDKVEKVSSLKDPWSGTMLDGLENGELMYFVHSYYVKPNDPDVSLSMTQYGSSHFCSSFQYRNIFASQFHPERSGQKSLKIYNNLKNFINVGVGGKNV